MMMSAAGSTVRRALWLALVTVLYLFLLAPVIITVVISFERDPLITFPPHGFTFSWYSQVVSNDDFASGFKISLIVGIVVTLIAVAVCVPAAYALTRRAFRGSSLLSAMLISPLVVTHVVLGLGLLLVLSPLGLIGTYQGLVIAHLSVTMPYVLRTTSISLMIANTECEQAARSLGANGWKTFISVTVPAIRPGVIAGALFAFLISFDEAVISLFVMSPSGGTLPVRIFDYVQYKTDPQLAALSTLLIALSIVFVVALERIIGLRRAMGD